MIPRHACFILLSCLWLAACNRQQAQPAPTLIPTAVLPAPTATSVPATPTSPLPSPVVAYTPIYEESSCEQIPIPETDDRAAIQCGFVIVPEDRHDLSPSKVRLAVVRILSSNPTVDPVPLIFLPGGPGSPILPHLAAYYVQFIVPMQADRDIILFDLRGVGLTEPELDCGELKLTYLQDLVQKFSDAERVDRYGEALFTCRDRLQAEGINLAAYHSGTIAADVKDILQVMGYEQAHLFGVSYGTRLAQQLMRDYPDLVKTAVLDSVVPLNSQFIPDAADWQADGLEKLFAACAGQPTCQTSYPDLEAVYQALQTRMAENPVPVTFTDPIQGNAIEIMADPVILEAALQWAVPNARLSPFVPQMLYDLHDGDGALLSSALTVPLLVYGDLGLGMAISVLCHDQVFSLTPEQLATGARSYPQLGILNTVSAYDNGRFLPALCREWGAAEPQPGHDKPVSSDIPTLILAGQLDTTTPPAFGRHIAQTLSHSYVVELLNQGHTPAFGPAAGCVQTMIRTFLNDPDNEPAHACHQEESGLIFFVPYTGSEEIALTPFSTADLPFTVMVPAGWEAGEHNHFYWLRFPGDVAQLAVQASPITIDEWLNFLVANYVGVGLAAFPDYAGEVRINGRVWQLYTTSYTNHPVTFSFTQEAGTTYLVSLASSTQEHPALYDNLLLPVLASFDR